MKGKIDRSDARAFLQYRHETETAALDGKPLEYIERIGGGEWIPLHPSIKPPLAWKQFDYRIAPAPQPTYEAWTFETADPSPRVRRKSDGKIGREVSYPDGVTIHFSRSGREWVDVSYQELYDDFEQLDGSMCGVKREEVEPEWAYFINSRRNVVWKMPREGFGEIWSDHGGWGESIRTREELARSTEQKQIPAHEALALIANAKGGVK